MKKRFSEEQIIGFRREAEAGMPIKDLCRRHGFSEASYYLWRSKFAVAQQVRRHERARCQAAQGPGGREHAAEEVAGRAGVPERPDQGGAGKKW
ncbi:hypothetical protein XOC_1718 [Xanthomonas oryzae pv. oryzicola BLS256]|uniref:Transposase n=1 Tax=Xanthomonas oryzae pv. oryzicola (strain BLS256) TaxID=383407 RepID=G7TLR6_XANOB|nr:hypothetical protein XOC_1718 [Xanthomonas oryzae pv. oryzicola BLS256]